MENSDRRPRNEFELSEYTISIRLRELTANLIRIVRGSGKLYEVEGQVLRVAEELERHRELVSHGVSQHVIDEALNIRSELETRDHPNRNWQDGQATIVKGALQYAASTLLNQNSHGANGHEEMMEGQRKIEELRAKHLR